MGKKKIGEVGPGCWIPFVLGFATRFEKALGDVQVSSKIVESVMLRFLRLIMSGRNSGVLGSFGNL